MTLENFCKTPKTMSQIKAEGYSSDMVYNRVKKGALVNINRQDEWGRMKHGKGLFQIADASKHQSESKFDAKELMKYWGAI